MKFQAFAAIILFITITGSVDIVFKRGPYYEFQSFYMVWTETWYQCIQRCFHYGLCEMVIFQSSRCFMYPVDNDEMSTWTGAGWLPRPYLVKKKDASKVFNESCANYYSCPLDSSCEHLPQLGFICTPMYFTWTLCKGRWVPFEGRCIQIKSPQKQQSDAQAACVDDSADLVSVLTKTDEKLIVKMTAHFSTSVSFVNTSFTNLYWISMEHSSSQGCFALSPDDADAHFTSRNCSDELYYICERTSTFTNYIAN
ncbi:uncharacterized protein LOC110465339 [Mizuhopecten yessoensis]|uniref:Secretory phospholipase A2 receptor n=1 Tax=Mizuhopecten yessoensis TaxID=6573 RepID=A0A210PRS2_MIZYE|nr:uncharacterized protein LOC110465339 [Mizuhopecten yessoensis]OWF39207.1 Secretory phospholipase A2 receptor [Mizuhopecten yessoensis]